MSVTLDPSINALVAQSQAMSQSQAAATAAVKSFKGALESQEAMVTKLISSAGLTTYNAQGLSSSVGAVGTKFSAES